jgi:hypothetical protein
MAARQIHPLSYQVTDGDENDSEMLLSGRTNKGMQAD